MYNRIYRFNKWASKSNWTLLLLISLILLSNFFITFGFITLGLIFISIVCLLGILRIKFLNGDVKFNREKYSVPKVGESIIIKKSFYWNGLFYKSIPSINDKPWYFTISSGDEYHIDGVEEIDGDWVIYFKYSGSPLLVSINYFESRNYWETKSNIRDRKLKKLGL